MRKTFNHLLIFVIILLSLSIVGCSSVPNKDNESIIKKAYNSLPDNDKRTIKDWEKSKLEDYKSDKDREVSNLQNGTSTNIKGIDTYRVTFKVPNSVLGDIRVYVGKSSEQVLGVDLRE